MPIKESILPSRWLKEPMRQVMEYLGIVRPNLNRKDPVAVPVWVPRVAAAIAGAVTLGVALCGWLLIRALVS